MASNTFDTVESRSTTIAVSPGIATQPTGGEISRTQSHNTQWDDTISVELRRRIIFKLSQVLLQSSHRRRDLSPILLEALHCALEQLLCLDDKTKMNAVEEWLLKELVDEGLPQNTSADAIVSTDVSSHEILLELEAALGETSPPAGAAMQERRFCERRFGERRIAQAALPPQGQDAQAQDAQAQAEENSVEHEQHGDADDRRCVADRRCGAGRRQQDQPQNASAADLTDSRGVEGDGANSDAQEGSTLERSTPASPPVKQAAADGASRLNDATISALLNSVLFRN